MQQYGRRALGEDVLCGHLCVDALGGLTVLMGSYSFSQVKCFTLALNLWLRRRDPSAGVPLRGSSLSGYLAGRWQREGSSK